MIMRKDNMTRRSERSVRLLFLIGDTGGGHRSAAKAVAQALDRTFPGRFDPLICDPMRGPDAPPRTRRLAGLYGPIIQRAPWLWGVIWRACGSPRILRWARRMLMPPMYDGVVRAVAAAQPAAIVSFHPLTGEPAVLARDSSAPLVPVITVVTDLVTTHRSWWDTPVDRVMVPSAVIADRCAKDGMPEGHYVETGFPVAAQFCRAPASAPERHVLKRSLGLSGEFLVVMTGGGEGSGGLYRRAVAVLRAVQDVDVAVICGRNQRLRRRLARLGERAGGRLTVHGFVDNMADWLRCADIVVSKAGSSTIAEATCCAAPLVLASHLPGQEEGNAELVVRAGAGSYAPTPRGLAKEIARLRNDPAALAAMRAASARAGRPRAAAEIADLLAEAAREPASPLLVRAQGSVADAAVTAGAGPQYEMR
jgi:1,2-diacylglycerol 3-beta-galactosyltransferase